MLNANPVMSSVTGVNGAGKALIGRLFTIGVAIGTSYDVISTPVARYVTPPSSRTE
jgi:hypothetical protein